MLDEIGALLEEREAVLERLKDNPDFQAYLALEDRLYQQTRTAARPATFHVPKPPSRLAPRAATRPTAAAPVKTMSKSKTREVTEQVTEILRQAHTPMSTRTILAELERRGVTIGGKNPVTNLSAKLSADETFRNVRHEGWEYRPEMKSKPIPLPAFLQR